ncbi:MAG TPA: O-antigen ligase family protein [Urbifossiella sp.]|jgi:hypothetical protein|nr:O-antigen ligase family protein [Urbifossiella sp.]
MGYALFILLNAVLFIRPEELFPSLEGSRLYLIVMALCLLVNAPQLFRVLSSQDLATNPIGVCVLGMLVAVPLSNIVRGDLDTAQEDIGEFGKVILYYFLAVAVLDTKSRLRGFLGWCVVLILGLTIAAQLQWHEYIDLEHMRPVRQRNFDSESGEENWSERICSTGIFNDPNDLCLVLVFGCLCCAYRAATGHGFSRWLWLTPIAPFVSTLTLTESRGGMLGLLAGVTGYLVARFGGKRAAPLVVICFPALLIGVGGRQSNMNMGKGDTANERVMLWAEGLADLLHRPSALLTGIGAHEHAKEFGLVAHNSFIHAYVELGLFGGSAFAGMYYWAVIRLRRTSACTPGVHDTDLLRARPFIIGMFTAYVFGIYSISRNYVIPTYMIVAIITSYVRLAAPLAAEHQVSADWVRRTAVFGFLTFVGLKVFTQVAGNIG